MGKPELYHIFLMGLDYWHYDFYVICLFVVHTLYFSNTLHLHVFT